MYEFSEGDMNIEFIDYRLPITDYHATGSAVRVRALLLEKKNELFG